MLIEIKWNGIKEKINIGPILNNNETKDDNMLSNWWFLFHLKPKDWMKPLRLPVARVKQWQLVRRQSFKKLICCKSSDVLSFQVWAQRRFYAGTIESAYNCSTFWRGARASTCSSASCSFLIVKKQEFTTQQKGAVVEGDTSLVAWGRVFVLDSRENEWTVFGEAVTLGSMHAWDGYMG